MNESITPETPAVKSVPLSSQKASLASTSTGTVIYGYLWNEARDQWLVDPEAAEVVKAYLCHDD